MSITRGGTILPCSLLPQSSDSYTVGGTHWTNEWSCCAFSGSSAFVRCCCFYCLGTQFCPTLATPWTVAPRLLCPWDFPGKNTGVGCHFLLPGIFLTQGSNLCLLYWQVDSLLLSHLGSPTLHILFPNYLQYSISLSLTGWPVPISQTFQTLPHLLQAEVFTSSDDLRALGTCSLFLWCCR